MCIRDSFIDADHGHIITGDLRIVENNRLRKLLAKGPKYRESEGISWNKAQQSITEGINDFITKWTNSEKLPRSLLTEWKIKVFKCLNDKINTLKTRIHPKPTTKILSDDVVKNDLDKLQERYVMVPIDKADNNVAFVCKRYYIEVIVKELGMRGNPSSTYEHLHNISPNEIIHNHQNDLQERFHMTVPEEMCTLPDIYWLPKLHKTPTKARFIIASCC